MNEHPKIKAALAQIEEGHAEARQKLPGAMGIPKEVRAYRLNTDEALIAAYDPRGARKFKPLAHVLPSGDVMTPAGMSLSLKRGRVQCLQKSTKNGPQKLGNLEDMSVDELAKHLKAPLPKVTVRGLSKATSHITPESLEVLREARELHTDLFDLRMIVGGLLDIDAIGRETSERQRRAMLDQVRRDFAALFGGSLDDMRAVLRTLPDHQSRQAQHEKVRREHRQELRRALSMTEGLQHPLYSIFDYRACCEVAEALCWARNSPELESVWWDYGHDIHEANFAFFDFGGFGCALDAEGEEIAESDEWRNTRDELDKHIPTFLRFGLKDIRAALDRAEARELEPDPFS